MRLTIKGGLQFVFLCFIERHRQVGPPREIFLGGTKLIWGP